MLSFVLYFFTLLVLFFAIFLLSFALTSIYDEQTHVDTTEYNHTIISSINACFHIKRLNRRHVEFKFELEELPSSSHASPPKDNIPLKKFYLNDVRKISSGADHFSQTFVYSHLPSIIILLESRARNKYIRNINNYFSNNYNRLYFQKFYYAPGRSF